MRIAFETTDIAGDFGKRTFPIMAERRVAEVVRKAGAVDHVGIATERSADLSTDLRDLQRVCKPCTCEIVRAGYQNLRFRAEPAQCGRVDESGAVALEGGAGAGFGWFRSPTLLVERTVSFARHDAPPSYGCGGCRRFLRDYRMLAGSSLARSSADNTSVACSYRRGMRLRRQVKIS